MNLDYFYNYTGIPNNKDIFLFKETFNFYQSDKAINHNYDQLYSALFKDKDVVNNILEIGIARGSSLKSWKKIFINANIIGVDFDMSQMFLEDRINTYYLDQTKLNSYDELREKCKNIKFDLIIDDGSHNFEESVNTLNKTLPWVQIGGWLIIEDIKQSLENKWKNIIKNISDEYDVFLLNMMDICNRSGFDDNIVLAIKRIK